VTFEFIADRPVLDFLPTLSSRGTTDDEGLRSDADLQRWVRESELVDTAPVIAPGDLERARELREAMYRLVAALIDGRAAAPDDRVMVNAAAAVPPPAVRLDGTTVHREGDLAAVLSVLARDCLELHRSPDRAWLRWCADGTCTRPFVDRSRGHRRRWCGMKGCGDRAKAAAYRRRQRAQAGAPGVAAPD
jgi:predicted RNA-binding Zn ribbon-like protein